MLQSDKRKFLLIILSGIFVILVILLTFFLVSLLLKKGEVLKPPETSVEFPSSPAGNFPPAP